MTATSMATAIVDRLAREGVREAVLCPGSRSAPLAFAFADHPAVRLHTRIDERTAGFLALGLAKTSGRPVAVFCTSGTAAANLHPAVLEAAHAGVPLVVVTADRPASLRGTLANQTTDQVGMYAAATPTLDLAEEHEVGSVTVAVDAPTHLNVQFSEPLLPEPGLVRRFSPLDPLDGDQAPTRRGSSPHSAGGPERGVTPIALPAGPRTVVVAGDADPEVGEQARLLAEENGWPLLAEPSSGARRGPNAIASYRLLLDADLGAAIERVVLFGRPTLSRPVTRLLSRGIEVCAVPAPGIAARRPHPVSIEAPRFGGFTGVPDRSDWLDRWRAADARASAGIAQLTADLGPISTAREVSRSLPPGGRLLVGASNPIRDLDLVATAYPAGGGQRVLANRGLAGIDGTLSTAVGMALARPGARSLALLGDVTFLHDSTALTIGPAEERPDLSIVVVNDDGGSIFATLEQGDPAYSASFERLFATPHGVDLGALCAATRTPHWRVESLPELRQALEVPNGGIEVIEVRCRRDDRRELAAAFAELGRTAGGA